MKNPSGNFSIVVDQTKKVESMLTDLMNQNAFVGDDDSVVDVTNRNWHDAQNVRTQVRILLNDVLRLQQDDVETPKGSTATPPPDAL